ncbi:hypothetical protein NKDENANG_02039 [Candidatus Entotheonellaceae bacterium PAL068K]
MPLYHYYCETCRNEFVVMRRLSEHKLPGQCPGCGGAAPRVLKAPHINTMAKNSRIAHQRNERSADEPRIEHRVASLPASRDKRHGHPHPRRPWMLGH